VLVESPIDAISFAVLDRSSSRKTIYLSTDGAGSVPLEFLRQLPERTVIIALDNDLDGEKMAHRLVEQLPSQSVRRLPKGKDWNEELKNTFNLKPQQHRQPERDQSRGFSL
jgi:5S rRNA maturation endonuclease (ribonuclease M5)